MAQEGPVPSSMVTPFPSAPSSVAACKVATGAGEWGVRWPLQVSHGLCAGPEPWPWVGGSKLQPLSPARWGTHSGSSSTSSSFGKQSGPWGVPNPPTSEASAASAGASASPREPPALTRAGLRALVHRHMMERTLTFSPFVPFRPRMPSAPCANTEGKE